MAITPSCDPATLVQQANCYKCIPKQARDAVRAFLLCQALNKSTPPCITPQAPKQISPGRLFPPTSTTITAAWSQPPNAGTLIIGYIVSWGTTSGGPYPNSSGLLPVFPKQYTITGLNPSTQYFYVIQAIGAVSGCNSANSTESNQTTTAGAGSACAAGTTFATNWANRVVANGGVMPSAATQLAIAQFQCGLITDGLDVLMYSWNAFVPDSLTAAITAQLISGGNSNDPWTNNNFVAGDLTVNGLAGNAATKWLNTGINPQNSSLTNNNAGVTIYTFTNNNTANAVAVGVDNGGFLQFLALECNGGTTFFFAWDAGSGVSAANAGFTGYISGNMIAANNHAIYEANSTTPHNTLVSGAVANTGGPTVPPFTIPIFAFTNNTGQSDFTDQRLSFVAIHQGLTSAQSAKFFARIQTLRQALGGGFV